MTREQILTKLLDVGSACFPKITEREIQVFAMDVSPRGCLDFRANRNLEGFRRQRTVRSVPNGKLDPLCWLGCHRLVLR
jgi:hypothetical protein